MIRAFTAVAAVALAVAFVPASALACDGNPDCPCNHKSAKKDVKADKSTAKAELKAADQKKVVVPQKAPAAKTEQTSIMNQVDEILAAKCSCSGQSDCTCKKGECKCSKCGGHFVTHPHEIAKHYVCGLCNPPARAGKGKASGAICMH